MKEFVVGIFEPWQAMTRQCSDGISEQVKFYGRGVLNSSNLEASTQHYHDEWPIGEWAPRGEAKVVRSSNPNLFVVYQPFNWTVSDGSAMPMAMRPSIFGSQKFSGRISDRSRPSARSLIPFLAITNPSIPPRQFFQSWITARPLA